MVICRCVQRSGFHLVCDCSEWKHGPAAGMCIDEIAFTLAGILSSPHIDTSEARVALAYIQQLLHNAETILQTRE